MERDYKLPKELYMQTLWFIRRYPAARLEYENCIGKSVEQDGQPHGFGISDPTARDAALRIYLRRQFEPVDKALTAIPPEYRKGLMDNIIEREPYPDYADLTTWKRWKRRLVFFVAAEIRKDEFYR